MTVRELIRYLVNFNMELEVCVVAVEIEDKYFRLDMVEEDAWDHKVIVHLKHIEDAYNT